MNILYRALRPKEIAAGGILIPKCNDSFVAPLRVPFPSGDCVGMNTKHAVRDQQLDGKLPTRGVSTTTSKEIAFEKYGKKHGIIAVIDRGKLKSYGIREYVVKAILQPEFITYPEDEEIILVQEQDGSFPKEIIMELIDIYA